MITQIQNRRGQATTELALLLPIMFFLIIVCVNMFGTNVDNTDLALRRHAENLEKFDSGKGLAYDGFTGDFIDAKELIDLIPLTDAFDIGDMATQMLAQYAADFLLGKLFSNISFFGTGKILPAMTQAYITSAVSSYVDSGFTEVDWEGAAWDSAVAGLSSEQSTKAFQGENGNGGRELFGSGLQQAGISFAGSEGDGNAAAMGFVNGVFGSDTFGEWSTGDEMGAAGQMMVGAGRGAATTATAGLLYGNFEWDAVAKSAGMGAIRTQAFADVITGGTYEGDARRSTLFGAVNGGLSSAISGGDFKSSMYGAMDGAFYSGQIQGNFGDSKLATVAGSFGYQAGKGLLQGNSIEAVGQSAMAGALSYAQSQATSKAQSTLGDAYSDIKSGDEAESIAENTTEQEINDDLAYSDGILDQFGQSIGNSIFAGSFI